jgi:hypothetical protein
MRCVLIIVTAIASMVLPVRAQQPAAPPPSSQQGPSPQQGPAFPSSGSDRGPAFPKSVSPTGSNPTNWVAPQREYTEPAPTWSRWGERWRR